MDRCASIMYKLVMQLSLSKLKSGYSTRTFGDEIRSFLFYDFLPFLLPFLSLFPVLTTLFLIILSRPLYPSILIYHVRTPPPCWKQGGHDIYEIILRFGRILLVDLLESHGTVNGAV